MPNNNYIELLEESPELLNNGKSNWFSAVKNFFHFLFFRPFINFYSKVVRKTKENFSEKLISGIQVANSVILPESDDQFTTGATSVVVVASLSVEAAVHALAAQVNKKIPALAGLKFLSPPKFIQPLLQFYLLDRRELLLKQTSEADVTLAISSISNALQPSNANSLVVKKNENVLVASKVLKPILHPVAELEFLLPLSYIRKFIQLFLSVYLPDNSGYLVDKTEKPVPEQNFEAKSVTLASYDSTNAFQLSNANNLVAKEGENALVASNISINPTSASNAVSLALQTVVVPAKILNGVGNSNFFVNRKANFSERSTSGAGIANKTTIKKSKKGFIWSKIKRFSPATIEFFSRIVQQRPNFKFKKEVPTLNRR